MARYSSKPFSALWNDSWNKKVDMNIVDKDLLTDLSFDKEQNKLIFVIKHYHREPKISRYVTSNYVRTPIYEDYSERTRVIKKFDKTINPIRFVNEEILNLNLEKTFILKIIDKIGIIPEWRKKEIELQNISKQIKSCQDKFRNFEKEKKLYNFKSYCFKKTNFIEQTSNFWLRFFLGFFTFFLSFVGFISKERALINKIINEKNKKWNDEHKVKIIKWNDEHKVEIDKKNKKILYGIENFNNVLEKEIIFLKNKFNKVKNKEIVLEKIDETGWIDLKNASNFSYSHLNNKKGVYIIWNKTQNKHYVGQSKNMSKRLLQHFKNGDVKNILFAKDWYSGDQFMYMYYFCKTKDELDSLEKRYINDYNAFERGYNSTNGNL